MRCQDGRGKLSEAAGGGGFFPMQNHVTCHDMTWHERGRKTSHQIKWHEMTLHGITWHHMTRHLASNHITPPHVTSQPTALLHLTPQPHITAHHNITTETQPPDGTAEGRCAQKSRFRHRTGWWPCALSIGKFLLWFTIVFPWNFRPQLARELLYRWD